MNKATYIAAALLVFVASGLYLMYGADTIARFFDYNYHVAAFVLPAIGGGLVGLLMAVVCSANGVGSGVWRIPTFCLSFSLLALLPPIFLYVAMQSGSH
jgi:hypothetical protein